MSLHAIADHMASKGRGPDSVLIHMSPSEVQGLQALAMSHGGSLTINPETGLPEAGFLDKLLPTILGFGISYLSGGTIDPKTAAMIVGGVQTVRTGDIGKGISAGLGAYGGAGIGAGMTAAGTGAIGSEAAGQSYLSSYAPPGVLEGAGAGLTADMAYNLGQAGIDTAGTQAASAAQQAAAERIAAASPFEKLSAGASKVAANPMDFANKENFKYMAAAAAPILADQAIKSNLPQTTTRPGQIRPYAFDPYGGAYTAGTPYEAAPARAAEGGLMGMNDGGYSPGQLDFAQHSEPVLRMAAGGMPGYAGGDLIREAYEKGDYGTANRLLSEAGMGAQDVVSKYGLNQADAAAVAKNLGYAGDMSGIQYAAPPATTGGLDSLAANQIQAPVTQTPTPQTANIAAIQGTPITGGLNALATNQGVASPIFDYFAGLDQTKVASGALDADIAAKMRAEKWTPGMVATDTGTPNKEIEYFNRFGQANQAADKAAAAKVTADQNAAYEASAKASYEASLKAAADERERTVFKTVYDPKTGREFISPAQAIQYGVTDYVTEMPYNREFMQKVDATAKNTIDSLMAQGKTFEQALDSIGSRFGMTGKEFYNSEVQGGIGAKDFAFVREAVATESGGLKFDELTAKLQAYKDKPPTTFEEFRKQQALYADYQNRYANSSGSYANMGGKAQDHTLKPKGLELNVTGYSEPVNFVMSNMDRSSTDFKKTVKMLQDNPEINAYIDELYKINPNASFFNAINPKYTDGGPKSVMASNFNVSLNNLFNDISRNKGDVAETIVRHLQQQKNLVGINSPDETGRIGNPNQTTMSNPEYRAIIRLQDSYIPIASDAEWNKSVNGSRVSRGETAGPAYRDPETGKGFAIQTNNATGQLAAIQFINQAGQIKTVYGGPEALFTAAYESGIPFSAFGEMAKKLGTEYLIPPPKPGEYTLPALQNGVKFSDFADGTAAKVLASDSYLKDVQNRALADYKWSIKNGTPTNSAEMHLQSKVDTAVNNQKIAKAVLGDQGGGTTASTASAQGAPAGLAALASNQTATTDTQTAPTGVAALAANTGVTAPNTGAAQFAAANNINLSKNISDWIAAHPNATDAQVDAEMAKYGVTGEDVAKALPQYGGSKGLSWALNQGNMGLSGLNKNIQDYVATHGNTATDRIVAENTLAKYGLNAADVKRATGKTLDELFAAKKVVTDGNTVVTDGNTKIDTGTKVITNDDGTKVTRVTTPTDITTALDKTLPPGIGGNTGPSIFGGGTTVNPNGTITTSPRIPGIPVGGFTGMTSLRDAYTKGGGSLGYIPETPKTLEEFNAKYNTMTGGSKQEYDYLMGNAAYSPVPYTPTGEIMKPYFESVGRAPVNLSTKKYVYKDGKYELNPAYVKPPYVLAGEKAAADKTAEEKTTKAGVDSGKSIYVLDNQGNTEPAYLRGDGFYYTSGGNKYDEKGIQAAAGGGLMALAGGGVTGGGNLNLNIPLNIGGDGGYNGYNAMGGGFGSTPSNFANNMGSAISNNMNAGMPDFRNQMQGFESQIQKLPSVMAYSDYGKSLGLGGGNDRAPTANEQARMQELLKAIQGDKGYLDLQSQMQGVQNKYQQQAMRSQSSGLQQRYLQQAPNAQGYAAGGMSSQYDLGGYSDGGRLLRGPGDGVSDSIPATIGNKRPARLADGEFVVPARIVSELGNGSTEAGARKLYAMMDRVQAARRGSIGKGKVAKNSRADKYLPA